MVNTIKNPDIVYIIADAINVIPQRYMYSHR